MERYNNADIKRIMKFIDDLKVIKPKDNYPVNMTKLSNLLFKIGFIEYTKTGSKRPFYHELLKTHPRYFAGRFLMTEAHGKRDIMYWRNFKDYCLEAIEYVIDRINDEELFNDEGFNENV